MLAVYYLTSTDSPGRWHAVDTEKLLHVNPSSGHLSTHMCGMWKAWAAGSGTLHKQICPGGSDQCKHSGWAAPVHPAMVELLSVYTPYIVRKNVYCGCDVTDERLSKVQKASRRYQWLVEKLVANPVVVDLTLR